MFWLQLIKLLIMLLLCDDYCQYPLYRYTAKIAVYTTLPHHLIKDKLIDLINRTFIRENTQYLASNEECAFFTSDVYNNHNL